MSASRSDAAPSPGPVQSGGGDSMGAIVLSAAHSLSKLATSSKKPLHKQIRAECHAVAQHIIELHKRNQMEIERSDSDGDHSGQQRQQQHAETRG